MKHAKTGDTVRFHYSCRLDDGTEYDTSRNGDPFELELGSGDAPWGLESAMIDMAVGETKILVVSPDQALGPHRADLLETIDRAEIEGDDVDRSLKLGSMVQTAGSDGAPTSAMIVQLTDDSVTLDTNHPLAGKRLNLEIELVGIVSA